MSIRSFLPAFLLAAALAPAAAAQTAVLGDGGAVHELRAGFYRSFFPESTALAPTTPVLVLLTTAADGSRSASLVPESDGLASDAPRLLLFDPGSGVFTAVWESAEMPSRRALRLAHLLPLGWTAPRLLVESPLGAPAPRIAVSRQQLAVGPGLSASRTVIHTVWRDEAGAVRYLPTVLSQGLDVGWDEVYSLTEIAAALLANAGGALTLTTPAAGLLDALAVEPAVDGGVVNVAFVEPASGRLASLRLGVLPLELSFFAADVHGAALELAPLFDPAHPGPYADKMRAHIIPFGLKYDLRSGVTAYVADRVDDFIRDTGRSLADGEAMAEALRTFTVKLAASLGSATATGDAGLIEIDLSAFPVGSLGGQTAQVIDLGLVGSWPLPATSEGDTTILPSADGRRLIVAWSGETGGVQWVESRSGGWSAPEAIGPASAGRALDLLRQRVH